MSQGGAIPPPRFAGCTAAHAEKRGSGKTRLQRLIDDGGEAQSQALRKGQMKKLKAFRKSPDSPLGEVVKRRLAKRTK
ncbi:MULTISPECIES: hypothetical protein [Bradyrhizobium]|uniref:Uncharacterized protein n=1 Tax=Bradyrhizobium brasilense TaxID=1419277 RepID=A0ABY8JI42_9BRAD|nr:MULTISPECIES: hypothetical protein [Bradyrhizobium]MCP1912296.1 hypothetical protein [Bradyrhizobium elkanii]MCP1829910.1 hypothetical protein [Bradyrhizobium sp. USDA 4545]MCP1848557.1 hypothetical protein [Bradyrhizobium sp. USDA 4541]MCP1923019.1 hypothetical protein [Bradyrhizobium sp. USDA 4532]WFU65057.1 hypothetical protein QA636_05795 [Bradyrhizobium brasilense]